MPVKEATQDTIASNDRGFCYGDGVFETIRIHARKPVLLDAHLARLEQGAGRLGFSPGRKELEAGITRLAPQFPQEGILKIIVSRGTGGRGYRPEANSSPTQNLSLHPLPDLESRRPELGIDMFVCSQKLAIQPALAGIKHLNRLEQVLASLEWPDDRFLEGLMLDTEENVIEGTRSNLFWAETGRLFTPALTRCGVAGILRNFLIANMTSVREISGCSLDRLLAADEVFICNSVIGVWPVKSINLGGAVTTYATSPQSRPFASQAQALFRALLAT